MNLTVCLGGHLLSNEIFKTICIYFGNRLLTKPSLVLRINLTMVVTRCSVNVSGLMIFFRAFSSSIITSEIQLKPSPIVIILSGFGMRLK